MLPALQTSDFHFGSMLHLHVSGLVLLLYFSNPFLPPSSHFCHLCYAQRPYHLSSLQCPFSCLTFCTTLLTHNYSKVIQLINFLYFFIIKKYVAFFFTFNNHSIWAFKIHKLTSTLLTNHHFTF